jgi:hypothetical protein
MRRLGSCSRFDPEPDVGCIEIPQRSRLLAHQGVLSYP